MAEARRSQKLVVVEPSTTSQPDASGDDGRLGRRFLWVLGVALALSVLLLIFQLERAGQLEQEVQSLRTELGTSVRALEAHRERMEQVRDRVDQLAAGVVELQILVVEPSPPEVPSEP
jgi:uncharacterized protein HemX